MLVELGFDLFRRWWGGIGDFVTTNKSKIAAKAGGIPYRHADSFPLLPFVNFSQILFDSACPLTSHGPKEERGRENPTIPHIFPPLTPSPCTIQPPFTITTRTDHNSW